METLVLVGGSFDPVHNDHIRTVRLVLERYGHALVLPCGPRKEKETIKRIYPVHRATMLQLSLGQVSGVEFDFSDLEKDHFTPTWELERNFRAQGYEPVHVLGSDLLYGEGGVREWTNGQELWNTAHFLVIPRTGSPIDPQDLPTHAQVVENLELDGSSTEVRTHIYLSKTAEERCATLQSLVPPEVAEYIETHGLYTGLMDQPVVGYSKKDPKLFVVADIYRTEAAEAANSLPFQRVDSPALADIIVVLGGDGTFLKAIRQYWTYRKPFYGVNFGTVGFLLNDVRNSLANENLFCNLELAHCPMLHISALMPDGTLRETLAFNDAWVEAEQFDVAEFDIVVNEKRQISFMGHVGLVSTVAGSTGYYFNIRREAYDIREQGLALTVSEGTPNHWQGTKLAENAVIEFVNSNPSRRKMLACADGKSGTIFGPVQKLTIRKSRVASARILKTENDFVRKLAQKQFPPK